MAKRVLAISNHATFIGGGEHSYLDLISRLPEEYAVMASLPSENVLSRKTRERGIATIINPLPRINPVYISQMAKGIGKLKNICRAESINLIYANGSRAAFYGGVVGYLCSIPVVWHCRVSEPDPYLDFILIRMVHRIVANSKATASRFPSYFQGKIDVVYNGFDLEWLRDPNITKPSLIKDGWIFILVVARVSRWKRHDVILSAFEKMALTEKNAHLICVGEEDHSEPTWWDELQNRTIKSRFSERIHWIGVVDDIRPWYRSASMMVLLSTNEPFGRVVVEAMACGVPVIATRSGGIPEIITDMQDGMLVPENDADALYEAAMKILKDESLKKRLTEGGFKRAGHFSMHAHIQEMVKVFTKVLNHSKKN
jgi:glycosyltransferase involved in cell wall biosynthesis